MIPVRNRAVLLAIAGIVALRCGGGAEPAGSAFSPPPRGVILILVDTLRADHLGAYGSREGLTPNLDAVAEHGVVFERAVAASSWTKASIAALFTSRYPTSIGVLGRDDAIAESVTTLAEIFRGQGGFETMGVITNKNAGRQFGFAQGFDYFEPPDLKAGYPDDYEIHIAEGVTEKALHLVDGVQGQRPFFLFLLYVDPHDPYLAHPGLVPTPEPDGRFNGSRKRLELLDRVPAADVTQADYDRIKYLYSGEVKYCDQWIGALLRGLEERGLLDQVILVVTADHGEGLWDHGFRAHGRDLYQEMVHVPLILRFPAAWGIATPRRIAEPISLVDVAPTLLAATGIPTPAEFWGSDLMPLVLGESRSPKHEFIYTEMDLDGRNYEAIRDHDVKLIRNRTRARTISSLQLFDLAADPAEKHNLAAEASRRLEEAQRALDDASAAVAADRSATARVRPADIDEDTAESLRALGYLGGRSKGQPKGEAELASTIDFATPNQAADQLNWGFYGLENGTRWMAGRASLDLGRRPGQTAWRIVGWIDLALHGRDNLTLSVRANRSEPQHRRIEASGAFVFEGALPADSLPTVHLDIECDHDFVPGAALQNNADERSLCVVVSSVGLI